MAAGRRCENPRMKRVLGSLLFTCVTLAGCAVQPPVAPSLEVPPDGASVCARHCGAMGLELSSVVLVRNSMGCVCTPAPAPAPPAVHPGAPGAVSDGGAAAVNGIVMIADEEEAARQQQAQNASHRRPR